MTPQEKAIELVSAYARIDGYIDSIDLSRCEFEKKCALIAVDEIFNVLKKLEKTEYKMIMSENFWLEVKQEIERL